ncbi:hypothetical protein Val02_06220 [Virgisporangium aliadipatigenens]|uniref:HEAT repeat domain-containing protein n=1 Tax=Virgisporangium aliadipatigenens TaxID=741659 RepID=A0A8J4DNE4_9ACTN|nr:HEAT repeat domain-containing protein [Virgisporangium aliadipatigenens]GIJ43736.1 hypothetical protein Val02_06220 [Virgisporangium aliadipatigenens]
MNEPGEALRHEVMDLLRRSSSADEAERRAAITGLGTVAGRQLPASVEHDTIASTLVHAARDTSPRVRIRAIRGLGALPASRSASVVMAAVTDDDYAVREAAIRTLISLDADNAAAALVSVARDHTDPVRCSALTGLRAAHTVDDSILRTLVHGLADPNASVQGAAMATLRALASRSPRMTEVVVDLARRGLTDPSPQRREISIELLRQLGEPGHRERCLAALDDPEPAVRQRAERTLER